MISNDIVELQIENRKTMEYTTTRFQEIYYVMEKLRCRQSQIQDSLEFYTNMGLYRGYLRDGLDAVAHTATTGEITPRLIGVYELQQIMDRFVTLRHSLVRR